MGFDTFEKKVRKKTHLAGKIAEALMANADFYRSCN
jgi:hypothetical protein